MELKKGRETMTKMGTTKLLDQETLKLGHYTVDVKEVECTFPSGNVITNLVLTVKNGRKVIEKFVLNGD